MKTFFIISIYILAGFALFAQNDLKYTSNNKMNINHRESDKMQTEQALPQKNGINIHKVDEKGNYIGESQPIQNNTDIPYKREEEIKPVNNSKANTPK